MFKKLNIGSKLLMISLAIGILPAALIGGIAVWQSRSALSEQAFSQLESMRELKRSEILGFFAERRGDMQVLLQMVANLRQNAWQKLQSIQENQLAQVEDYFHTRLNHINILSRTEAVAQAIEQFSEAFDMDGGEAGMTWESIKGMVDPELQHYRKTLGYEDLLLINPAGMIVYTTHQGDDFGEDLRDGSLRNSSLGEALERVLADPKPMLQDFAAYAPADERQVMFVLGPVYRFDKLVGFSLSASVPRVWSKFSNAARGWAKAGKVIWWGNKKAASAIAAAAKYQGKRKFSASVPRSAVRT